MKYRRGEHDGLGKVRRLSEEKQTGGKSGERKMISEGKVRVGEGRVRGSVKLEKC